MTIPSSDTMHASCVAIGGSGVLIEGASGAGKSDLALRLIDRGAVLVSDDCTIVQRRNGTLLASPPSNIAGKMEVREIGIVDMPHAPLAPVALVVALGEPTARMPEVDRTRIVLGIDVPLVALVGRDASAPMKVELALSRLGEAA